MVTKEVVINNQVGLHARPATFFIQKANEFKKQHLDREGRQTMSMPRACSAFSLWASLKGTAVNLIADGADEATAVDTLSELIASDFTE